MQVSSCGCSRCVRDQLQVKGQLQAADTSEPIPYGKVQFHNGETVYADNTGHFTIIVSNGLQHIVLTASDIYGNYVQTTKVVVPTVMSGITNTVIRMLRKAVRVSFKASDDTVLTMGGKQEDEVFAGIHIPPQSVFSDDGSVYTGEVYASVNVIDPRNMTDIINAPSDFTFVDDEGEVQPLRTYGMFNLELSDPAGNPLQTEGDVELMLDAGLLGYSEQDLGDNMPKLWVLDVSTGKWMKVANMKKQKESRRLKRQTGRSFVIVGNVDVCVASEWFNYDDFDTRERCFSKMHLYETNAFEEEIFDADPYVIISEGNTHQGYSGNLAPYHGYCVVHPCDLKSTIGNHGYVYIEHNGKRAFSVNNDAGLDAQGIKDEDLKKRINYKDMGNAISVNFSYHKQQPAKGPFYISSSNLFFRGWFSADCEAANASANHFRFYLGEESKPQNPVCDRKPYNTVNDLDTIKYNVSNPDYYIYAFYPKMLYPVGASYYKHVIVYIKVMANSPKEVSLEAQSLVGTINNGSVKPGDKYGERTGCAERGKPVCLEVKASGYVARQPNELVGYDETHVVIQTVRGESRGACSGYRISTHLAERYDFSKYIVPNYRFEMKLSQQFENQYSHLTGVYLYKAGTQSQSKEDAMKIARQSCEEGVNPNTGKPSGTGMTETNWALEFNCN